MNDIISNLSSYISNIKQEFFNQVKFVNELGVKPPITENDYARLNAHVRNTRSVNSTVEDNETKGNTAKIFLLSDEDKEFIKKELELLSINKHPVSAKGYMNDFNSFYFMIIADINRINNIAGHYNEYEPADLFNTIKDTSKVLGYMLTYIQDLLFIIKDDKGNIGFPYKEGIQTLPFDKYHDIYYILEHFHSFIQSINISVDILYKFKDNYKELFKDAFKQDIMDDISSDTNKIKETFYYIASYLKNFNANAKQNLDHFIDIYSDNEAQSKQFRLLGTTFDNKESAEKCLQNMNKNALAKKIEPFILYEYFDSLYQSVSGLTSAFESIHKKIVKNETIYAEPQIANFNFFSIESYQYNLYNSHYNLYDNNFCPQISTGTNNVTQSSFNHTQLAGGIAVGVAFVAFVTALGFSVKSLWNKYYSNNQVNTDEGRVLYDPNGSDDECNIGASTNSLRFNIVIDANPCESNVNIKTNSYDTLLTQDIKGSNTKNHENRRFSF